MTKLEIQIYLFRAKVSTLLLDLALRVMPEGEIKVDLMRLLTAYIEQKGF